MNAVIRLNSGRSVNPLDIRPDDIDVRDIAHALSMIPRFAGHTRFPISVGYHSVFVARLCAHLPAIYQLQALYHDGSEAYLGDVTKWLKSTPEMAGYRAAEERAQQSIFKALNVPPELHPDVEKADRIMVRFEGESAFGYGAAFFIDHPNYPKLTDDERRSVMMCGSWTTPGWLQVKEMFLDQDTLIRRRINAENRGYGENIHSIS